jgi:hypothetical protein
MSIWDTMKNVGSYAFLPTLLGKLYGDPEKDANRYMNQIPGVLHEGYDPFAQMGKRLAPQLESQYGNMMQNPSELLQRLGSGYKQSPGYQFRMNEAMRGAGNAAAAGGYTGSPEAQNYAAKISEGLSSQDFNDYMQQALGLYGGGLQGMQGLENQGYGANTDLTMSLANLLGGKGQQAYESAASRNKMINDLLGGLLKSGASYAGGGM